jgi:hypothetical protein
MVLHDAFADVQPQTRSTLACSLEGLITDRRRTYRSLKAEVSDGSERFVSEAMTPLSRAGVDHIPSVSGRLTIVRA